MPNADNATVEVETLGRVGREQTVRTGVFALAGESAPLVSIARIAKAFVGQELVSDGRGEPTWRKVFEPSLGVELVGLDGQRKTMLLDQTSRHPNVFRHVVDAKKVQPFFPEVGEGRVEVRLGVDGDGYPLELSLRPVVALGGSAVTKTFSGYGELPRGAAPDAFSDR